MAKAILTTKIRPAYDDLPEQQYHFPRTYLNQVRQVVGDRIIYYEPRRQDDDPGGREGRQSYFATARVTGIRPDEERPDHYYADIADYIDFSQGVPFRADHHYFESQLRKDDGTTNKGAFGRAVRLIPDDEFDLILAAGFSPLVTSEREPAVATLAEEERDFERPIQQQLVQRPFREAAFSRTVRAAYNSTCALTGFRIVIDKGRAESEAAHIKPVGDSHNGPDSIRNGIALSRTMHWLFDRGLVTIEDDYSILLARGYIPDKVRRLILPELTHLPASHALRPHPVYLRYHRENIFKG